MWESMSERFQQLLNQAKQFNNKRNESRSNQKSLLKFGYRPGDASAF
jgi:hypothetical protein